ncbi:hypothetical protein N7532_007780 [Penicillium argentinense]|uniref:Mmc1 C-terminal domain-containing protein n=1 Tax=Penicillium argentinense TaxID=1131581 RepID=A0A9W9EWD3_9EURO|nr:uncharacterized protein N7532_007780 [Penicillium argentinense]KAJ5089096.1 hypothetical protein N7532_007780 [Penicillium argentinense]
MVPSPDAALSSRTLPALQRPDVANAPIDQPNAVKIAQRAPEEPVASAGLGRRLLDPASGSHIRSFTTSPAINPGKTVPPQFKELYDALSGVRDASIEQVSVSRLQLALRGLESEAPLVRVAVLGLDNADFARKLVRLLLADPLGPRESWEDLLDGYDENPTRGVLIRYGEVSDSIPNALLPTITIPSPILKKSNMEILVSSLGSDSASSGGTLSADTFLVPNVTIQTSHSGRQNVVRYPVHRSIVCANGVDGLLAFSTLMGRSNLKNEVESVRGAIGLSLSEQNTNSGRLSFVNIQQATTALDRIRESVQNAMEYERGWNGSGMQTVIDWLSSSAQAAREDALNPALVPLIESLLDAADQGVIAHDAQVAYDQTIGVAPEEVRSELESGVTTWAERAHTELRSSLEAGFASPRWRGLAWWKLFWRVDDVSMITSEILQKQFLRRAEQEVIWTSGKYEQAGLLSSSAESMSTSTSTSTSTSDTAPAKSTPPPWPTQITDIRTKLLTTTVPSLQALAQSLVLFSVSTTTLTSALSALTYVSIPAASVYESCTLAAVGLIYSLRRQQKKWDVARGFWEDEVREEGRNSLLDTETSMRKIVREGGKQAEDPTDHRAREAIVRARKALEDVKA